jgi:hypothetical protein
MDASSGSCIAADPYCTGCGWAAGCGPPPPDPSPPLPFPPWFLGAGVGGDWATVFAADLFDMYGRYARSQGWQWEVAEYNEHACSHGQSGLRSAVAVVNGDGAYGRLRLESGVHRWGAAAAVVGWSWGMRRAGLGCGVGWGWWKGAALASRALGEGGRLRAQGRAPPPPCTARQASWAADAPMEASRCAGVAQPLSCPAAQPPSCPGAAAQRIHPAPCRVISQQASGSKSAGGKTQTGTAMVAVQQQAGEVGATGRAGRLTWSGDQSG